MEIVIDAQDAVVGRLSTYAAKQALIGNKVEIVNCEKAIISGNKKALQEVAQNRKNRGGTAQKGPYFSKNPEKIVKRSIRGMLPWKKTRGREAYKLIKCYVGVPEELAKKEKIEMRRNMKTPYLTVAQVSKFM